MEEECSNEQQQKKIYLRPDNLFMRVFPFLFQRSYQINILLMSKVPSVATALSNCLWEMSPEGKHPSHFGNIKGAGFGWKEVQFLVEKCP